MHRKQTVMQNPIPCLGSLERNSRTGLRAASIGSISLLAVGSGILQAPGKPCRTLRQRLSNRAVFRISRRISRLVAQDSSRRGGVSSARMRRSQGIAWSWYFGKRT